MKSNLKKPRSAISALGTVPIRYQFLQIHLIWYSTHSIAIQLPTPFSHILSWYHLKLSSTNWYGMVHTLLSGNTKQYEAVLHSYGLLQLIYQNKPYHSGTLQVQYGTINTSRYDRPCQKLLISISPQNVKLFSNSNI